MLKIAILELIKCLTLSVFLYYGNPYYNTKFDVPIFFVFFINFKFPRIVSPTKETLSYFHSNKQSRHDRYFDFHLTIY